MTDDVTIAARPLYNNVFRPHGPATSYSSSATFEVNSGCLIVRDANVLLAIYSPGEWKTLNDA